jgi:hypothetical protein
LADFVRSGHRLKSQSPPLLKISRQDWLREWQAHEKNLHRVPRLVNSHIKNLPEKTPPPVELVSA